MVDNTPILLRLLPSMACDPKNVRSHSRFITDIFDLFRQDECFENVCRQVPREEGKLARAGILFLVFVYLTAPIYLSGKAAGMGRQLRDRTEMGFFSPCNLFTDFSFTPPFVYLGMVLFIPQSHVFLAILPFPPGSARVLFSTYIHFLAARLSWGGWTGAGVVSFSIYSVSLLSFREGKWFLFLFTFVFM